MNLEITKEPFLELLISKLMKVEGFSRRGAGGRREKANGNLSFTSQGETGITTARLSHFSLLRPGGCV
jgi:hypothetical protein